MMGQKRRSSILSDKLTNLVIKYKTTGEDKLLEEIIKHSEGLIYHNLKFFGMLNYDRTVLDDIIGECSSVVLLKAIKAFKPIYKTAFSTFYTWKLKGYLDYRNKYYKKRKELVLNKVSLEYLPLKDLGDSAGISTGHDIVSNFSSRLMHSVKREMSDIFGLTNSKNGRAYVSKKEWYLSGEPIFKEWESSNI